MASKAKHLLLEVHFPRVGWGKGFLDRGDMAPPQLECHSLIVRPILCKLDVVIFRQQFKTFDSNNFTLSSMFPL